MRGPIIRLYQNGAYKKSDFPENIAGSARKYLQIANRTSHTFTIHTCVPDANVH